MGEWIKRKDFGLRCWEHREYPLIIWQRVLGYEAQGPEHVYGMFDTKIEAQQVAIAIWTQGS